MRNAVKAEKTRRRDGSINPGSYVDRALDYLEADGGWLALANISGELGTSDNTTRKALVRLMELGFVDRRVVDLTDSATVHEYRFLGT